MNDSDKPVHNIFLIGFMGNGKTYWGKLWAAESGLEFFDLDHVIEKEEQKTIAAIFEENGEAYFRQKETDVLKTFSQKTNCIIACGGGTPCFNNNMQWMNDNGTTVYLAATPADIFKRVIGEQAKRPLIKDLSPDELIIFIEKKLQERAPVYNTAKIILPVTEINAATINTLL
ncbi:shikimate kinase [Ferruginibacter sp. SUN106]|uniref:shikimate kinase n=1 Tax=Ferruginibacter sp. SUN106 TaxID=2978348 RepID=UPI003D365BF0